jgi:hypothetical protein
MEALHNLGTMSHPKINHKMRAIAIISVATRLEICLPRFFLPARSAPSAFFSSLTGPRPFQRRRARSERLLLRNRSSLFMTSCRGSVNISSLFQDVIKNDSFTRFDCFCFLTATLISWFVVRMVRIYNFFFKPQKIFYLLESQSAVSFQN